MEQENLLHMEKIIVKNFYLKAPYEVWGYINFRLNAMSAIIEQMMNPLKALMSSTYTRSSKA